MSKKIYAGMIQSQINTLEKSKNIPPEKRLGYIGNHSFIVDDDGVVRRPNKQPLLIVDPNASFNQIALSIAEKLIVE